MNPELEIDLQTGDLGLVKLDLSRPGVSLLDRNKEGENALSLAARSGHIQIVRYLLRKGAYIDLPMKDGRTVVQHAIEAAKANHEGYKKTLAWIEAAGELMDHASGLKCALKSGPLVFTMVILQRCVNARRVLDGKTALHLAIENKDNELIETLLYNGADVTIVDKKGHTPDLSLLYVADPHDPCYDIQHEDPSIKSLLLFAHMQAIVKKQENEKYQIETMENWEDRKERWEDRIKQLDFLGSKLLETIKIIDREKRIHLINRLLHLLIEPLERPIAPYTKHLNWKLNDFIVQLYSIDGEDMKESLDNYFYSRQIFSVPPSKDPSKFTHRYCCSVRDYPITRHFYFESISFNFDFKLDAESQTFENLEELRQHLSIKVMHEKDDKKRRYEAEMQSRELKRISENGESSMRMLSDSQSGVMRALRLQYAAKLQKMGGVTKVLENFNEYLEKMFQKTAPSFNGKKLPLQFDKEIDCKEVRELYYTNPFHTAWRYFLNPNPWIAPNATYAAISDEGDATHASISEQAKTDLAYLWLAASDTSIMCIRGMTTESMMENFAFEIAYINRAHNWDSLDAIKEGAEKAKIKAEMREKWGKTVDDLKPDNPSCQSGVEQRLMQSINGNPITETKETRALDASIIRNKVGDLFATRFNQYLENKSAQEIQELLNIFEKKFVLFEDISIRDQKLLDEFKLSYQDINEMVAEMINLYGDKFIWEKMKVGTEHFYSFEEYARKLAITSPWKQSFSERLLNIAKGHLEKLEKSKPKELLKYKEHKELKETKELKDAKALKDRKEDKEKRVQYKSWWW